MSGLCRVPAVAASMVTFPPRRVPSARPATRTPKVLSVRSAATITGSAVITARRAAVVVILSADACRLAPLAAVHGGEPGLAPERYMQRGDVGKPHDQLGIGAHGRIVDIVDNALRSVAASQTDHTTHLRIAQRTLRSANRSSSVPAR